MRTIPWLLAGASACHYLAYGLLGQPPIWRYLLAALLVTMAVLCTIDIALIVERRLRLRGFKGF